MITGHNATLLELTGGVRLKQRVQHPKVHERKDRGSYYWFFRYRHDELRPRVVSGPGADGGPGGVNL